MKLFPPKGLQLATQTIARIAEKTEDKQMVDAREKAIRDQQWALNAAFQKGEKEGEIRGEIKGEIKLVEALQEILGEPVTDRAQLQTKSLEELHAMTSELRSQIANRR